jgi:hypothetical protein
MTYDGIVTDSTQIITAFFAFAGFILGVLNLWERKKEKNNKVHQCAQIIKNRLENLIGADENSEQWQHELWYLGEDMQRYYCAISAVNKRNRKNHEQIFKFIKPIYMDNETGLIQEALEKISEVL